MSETTKRGLEISITAVFVLALLLVGAVLIFSGGTASAKQFATLRLLGGQVAVQRGNGAFETGEDGTSLREGDTVQTGPDGRASIEYFDGSLTRLDVDTSFTLVTLETLSDAEASRVIEGSQAGGNSYHRVAERVDAQSRFEIETPTATASLARSKRSPSNCSRATGSRSTDAPITSPPSASRATEAGPRDRPNRRRDPARGSRGRFPRPPPRAPAVRAARPAARPAVGPAERRLRHRPTSAPGRGSR